jgi:hypothetical protein
MPLSIKLVFVVAAFYALSFAAGYMVSEMFERGPSGALSNMVASLLVVAWLISIVIGVIGLLMAISYGLVSLLGS